MRAFWRVFVCMSAPLCMRACLSFVSVEKRGEEEELEKEKRRQDKTGEERSGEERRSRWGE